MMHLKQLYFVHVQEQKCKGPEARRVAMSADSPPCITPEEGFGKLAAKLQRNWSSKPLQLLYTNNHDIVM